MWRNKLLPENLETIASIAFNLAGDNSEPPFCEDDYLYEFDNSDLIPSQLSYSCELNLIEGILIETLLSEESESSLKSMTLSELLKLLKGKIFSAHFDGVWQAASQSCLIRIPNKNELKNLHYKIEDSVNNICLKDDTSSLEELIRTEPLLLFDNQLNDVSAVSLLHYVLIRHHVEKQAYCDRLNREKEKDLDYSNLVKRIPTIEVGLIDDNLEEERVGILNQTINFNGEEMPIPTIYEYHVEEFFRLGESLNTVLLTNVKNIGLVYYKYILYIFESNESLPSLIISAETNPMLIESDSSSVFLGVFFPGGRQNLGVHRDLSKEGFVSIAHDVVRQAASLDYGFEFSAIDVDEQKGYLEKKLEDVSIYMTRHEYVDAYLLLQPLVFKLRDSAHIQYFSRSLLYVAACCIELAKYEEAAVYIEEGISIEMNRGKPDNLAFFLCESGKNAYLQKKYTQAKSLFEKSLSIKATVSPRIVREGLAVSRKFFNSEIETELYLLALVFLQQNDLENSERLLNYLRASCARKFHTKMLGKALDLLSVVTFKQSNYPKSIALLAKSLKIKHQNEDRIGIIISSTILQLFFLGKGSEISTSLLQDKLCFKERI
jgi:hypothetical protein